ncbi:MAG: UDP-N-acetylmuramoyl-tripeptide--D-alanyl-D-alanine ligase [Chlamydiales bacterium]|nr:UDP-N-acetylmuramoyl-tripeptide--D-alanyl-D-alanine ligase [Chlamydiales bacterium]MCH9619858.1 UDP-N-acetylmuramoyl-tripeptide--D-alanyl-D-alanine ligase [Chlamydiales bacterium]MCH9622715.1 UDP-N-acetylmuramoyl-tripeptide--D-alanyl-D-alanine ligase [Chlamydiales bacterium]
MKPLPLSTIAKFLKIPHRSKVIIRGGAIDSRLVEKGDLFFAVKGKQVDGHIFLKDVAQKEGAAAVVDATYCGEDFGLPLLRVPDVTQALQIVGHQLLKTMDATVVAITGTLGKTSTKNFAKCLLETKYKVFATPRSYNSQLTLPLSLFLADGDEEVLLLEMGMTEPGQIRKLVEVAPPDIALLTSVALQHVDHFPDGLRGIAREKGSIFSHEKTTLALLPKDLPFFDEIVKIGTCHKLPFTIDHPFDQPIPGFKQNLAAAIALAKALDVPQEEIEKGAQQVKSPPMRFERMEREGVVFINDAYNANPNSVLAAFASLPLPKPGGQTIAVLSEMDALASYTVEGHQMVAKAALKAIDSLLCIGERCKIIEEIWKKEGRSIECFACRNALKKRLFEIVHSGDVVLLKGARSYSLDVILD